MGGTTQNFLFACSLATVWFKRWDSVPMMEEPKENGS